MDLHTLRFIVLAAAIYGALHYGYHRIPDQVLRGTIYPTVIGNLAADTINTLTPDRKVRAIENSILSSKAKLNIVRGCDGSGVLFMLVAAILGFGAHWRKTLVGLALGVAIVYLINQVRIVGLYYVIEHNRLWFPPVHTYYAPTLIILLISIYFLFWTRWAVGDLGPEPDDSGPDDKPAPAATPPATGSASLLDFTGPRKRILLLCGKGLMIWFLLAQAGQQWGAQIIQPLLPLYEDAVETVNDGYRAEISIVKEPKGEVLQLNATTIKPMPVTPDVSLSPGRTIPVTVTLLHQLVPIVILLTILLTWPARHLKHRMYLLLAAVPCIAIIAIVTTPMQLLGTLEISFQNYAASLGYLRDAPTVLTWMVLTEGGARWLIPALIGLAAGALVQRWVERKQAD